MPSVASVRSTQAASSATSWLTRRLSPRRRGIDTATVLLVFLAPLSVGEELADVLWQEGSAGDVGLFQCPGRYTAPGDAVSPSIPTVRRFL